MEYYVENKALFEKIKLFSFMSNPQNYYHFKLDFQKSGPTYKRQLVNPRHQMTQGK